MSDIDFNADFLDVRDIAEAATEALEVFENEDAEYDAEEVGEARELLETLAKGLAELGTSTKGDFSDVAQEWESIGDNQGPTIVSESGLEDYVREFIEDCGYIPADLPALIANNLDWEGIVEDFTSDSTSFQLDGKTFYTT
jgi:hypothetical protein